MASATATSNWLFSSQSGYFMPSSEWNPLLHTWTLSVEIQFYLLFPFALLGLARWNARGLPIGLFALLALSLLYCIWPRGGDAPFYDSFARAWEFLLGALLHHARAPKLSRFGASIFASLALIAIGTSVATLTRDSFFPDWRALIPTIATATLILTLRHSAFANAFESKPAIGVGQMSYSIYIWHWPVIVFSTYVWPDAVGLHWKLAIVLTATLALSFVTWRWLEGPIRRRSLAAERPTANQMLATGFLAVGALSTVAWHANGWPNRFDRRTIELDNYANDISPRREKCHLSKFRAQQVARPCVYGAQAAPEFAFWSDSHGVELIAALTPWLEAKNKSAAQFSFSSCAPHDPPALLNDCDKFNRAALATIAATSSIRTVVLAGATDEESYRHNTTWMKEFDGAARKLAKAGKRLVIIYPVPSQPFPAPRAMANFHRFSEDYRQFQTRTPAYLFRTRSVFNAYDLLGSKNIVRVYPHQHLCSPQSCAISDGRRPFYFDDNHLSLYGAKRLVPALTLAMDTQ